MFLKLEFSIGNVSYEKNGLHFWQLKIGQNSIFFFNYWLSDKILNTFQGEAI